MKKIALILAIITTLLFLQSCKTPCDCGYANANNDVNLEQQA